MLSGRKSRNVSGIFSRLKSVPAPFIFTPKTVFYTRGEHFKKPVNDLVCFFCLRGDWVHISTLHHFKWVCNSKETAPLTENKKSPSLWATTRYIWRALLCFPPKLNQFPVNKRQLVLELLGLTRNTDTACGPVTPVRAIRSFSRL